MTSRRTKISPKSGRGPGHVTPTIFGSTVGYPSDSLASCYPRDARLYASAGLCDRNVRVCLSVRLFVRPSVCHEPVSLLCHCQNEDRHMILQHLVAPLFQFSDAKFHPNILRGSRAGLKQHFLDLSINISKTLADMAKVSLLLMTNC